MHRAKTRVVPRARPLARSAVVVHSVEAEIGRAIEPGEALLHEAIMDGHLGMPWWSAWVEHPDSQKICDDLNRIKAEVCGCGRNQCTPRHGVVRHSLPPSRFMRRRDRHVWLPIAYAERLLFLQEVISGARERRRRDRLDPRLSPRLKPLWAPCRRCGERVRTRAGVCAVCAVRVER